ncbi:MAG: hypothetical protein KatS3mg065_0298 [Chloroflexota bacterium]|nr:MAG: hypothetical protein KatS3mg065_0298 [Chloroflexota bacterium]
MTYALGVDLGTTYSAAAVAEAGRVEVFGLGTVAPAIPSVVVLRDDGEVLVGEAAERRAITEPTRTAREFKRRLGDPAPLVLGGTPYGAEALMAHLLRAIVEAVYERQGARPERIVVTHPANYGPYKKELLVEMVRLADVGQVDFLTEPEAAAINYAEQDRLDPGQIVAVYDFGGGTFDAAVLRKTADGFEILGQPEGMERLGGIDFDQAIFAHVDDALGGQVRETDASDPMARAALARLRTEIRLAKESLSTDTDVTIPVMLPRLQTEVRLTRTEFEAMIRPRLSETIAALERAVRSAGIGMADVSRILLVGGSSRIPLVADMVGRTTGRPIAVDAHPKFAIALGAARYGMATLPTVPADLTASRTAPPVAPPLGRHRDVRSGADDGATDRRRDRESEGRLAAHSPSSPSGWPSWRSSAGGWQPCRCSTQPRSRRSERGSPSARPGGRPEQRPDPTAPRPRRPPRPHPAPRRPPPARVPPCPRAPLLPCPGAPAPGRPQARPSHRGSSGPWPASRARATAATAARPPRPSSAWPAASPSARTGRSTSPTPTTARSGPSGTASSIPSPTASPPPPTSRSPPTARSTSPTPATTASWPSIGTGRCASSPAAGGRATASAATAGRRRRRSSTSPKGSPSIQTAASTSPTAGNNRIRRVDWQGIITTVAGVGAYGFVGDGGPAILAQLAHPVDVEIDAAGNLLIADRDNGKIRRVDAAGIISVFAGIGSDRFEGPADGAAAAESPFYEVSELAVDSAGNVYANPIRTVVRIDGAGIVEHIAGGGSQDVDGLPPHEVAFAGGVRGIAIDPSTGTLYIASGPRVRQLAGVAAGAR